MSTGVPTLYSATKRYLRGSACDHSVLRWSTTESLHGNEKQSHTASTQSWVWGSWSWSQASRGHEIRQVKRGTIIYSTVFFPGKHRPEQARRVGRKKRGERRGRKSNETEIHPSLWLTHPLGQVKSYRLETLFLKKKRKKETLFLHDWETVIPSQKWVR